MATTASAFPTISDAAVYQDNDLIKRYRPEVDMMAEAAAEVQRGFREMIRGCSGGAEHPLVKRASEIREALLLLLESKEKT